MSTNIYTLDGKHIGKRYAAGNWCWDCRVCLNVDDPSAPFGQRVLDKCPSCGQKRPKHSLYNPAMRELGFDKSGSHTHRGIDGASGFIWRTHDGLGNTIADVKRALSRRRFVVTEYEERWPIKQFWNMFNDIIPEQYSDREFS